MFNAVLSLITTAAVFAEPLVMEREAQLKAQTEIWSNNVCLSDLVSDGWLQSRCAVDRTNCCRWKIEDGHTLTLKRAAIQQELAKANFGGISIVLRGAEEIAITQVGRELSVAEIEEKITSQAASRLAEEPKNISLTSFRLSSPVNVALAEESEWDVMLQEPISERGTAKIISTHDTSRVLGWAQYVMRADSEVYVARKMIRPTDEISAADFELRRVNILPAQTAGTTLFRSAQFPAGTRARQSIATGAALTATAIERVPLVKLGDTVTLILRSDSLKISTKGIAQSSAGVGDMVTVQLSRYNRTFRGRLMDGRLVEVWL